MQTHFKPRVALTAAAALIASSATGLAHPGSHIGAGHNHFFGGGELLILVALVSATAVLLYNRRA